MLLVLCISTSIPASNFWLHLFEGLEKEAVMPNRMGLLMWHRQAPKIAKNSWLALGRD